MRFPFLKGVILSLIAVNALLSMRKIFLAFLCQYRMIFLLKILIDAVKVILQIFEWEVVLIEVERFGPHLHLEGHLSIVQEPVFSKETDVVLPLNKSKVGADVHLVLELACELEKHFLLLQEPKLELAPIRMM